MARYLAGRLLLMPVTLALALLLLFALVNLAPGEAGDDDDPRGSAERRASQRAFREQFGLDRPILLDTRGWTRGEDVRRWLDEARGPDALARARAERALDDLGTHGVRHWVRVARDDADEGRARAAAEQLARVLGAQGTPPGGVWRAGASADEVARARAAWALWWPQVEARYEARSWSGVVLDTRLARFFRNVVALDFGRSFVDRSPVLPAVMARLGVSVTLGAASILLAYALAIPLGVWSATRAGRRSDRVVSGLLFALYAAPSFFVGTVLLEALAAGHPLRLFPASGFASVDGVDRTALEHARDVAWHLVLPVLTYTAAVLAALSRYARAGVAEVLRADHVRTARAKGLPELVVLVRHVARNGMIPVLTLLGGLLPALVSGSVVIEVVFGVPGVGLYLYDAINLRDYNAVMGVLVIVSAATVVGTWAADVAVALADPRVRLG